MVSCLTLLIRRQLEAPIRQFVGLSEHEPVTRAHLAAALTAGLTAAKARRALQRLGLADAVDAVEDHSPSEEQAKETAALWHGRMVVQAAMERGGGSGLQALMARFRAAFVHDLQPRHLPGGWSVDHRAERDFGPFSVYKQAPYSHD